jgi:Putative arginyl-tRNA:protein arginylyltransferase
MGMSLVCFPDHGLPTPIFEETRIATLTPPQLDELLASGWRHFGDDFFRYNIAFHGSALCGVLALRIRLSEFGLSKSQRRILRRNGDATTHVLPTRHCEEYDALFGIHRIRFQSDVPDSLRDFLSDEPADRPCENVAIEVRVDGRLAAVSFMDAGRNAASSVYAMFDPAMGDRSPGILTLLLEIEEARRRGMEFLYVGYAYTVPSFYDYKKRLSGLEAFDWGNGWTALPPDFVWRRPWIAGSTKATTD